MHKKQLETRTNTHCINTGFQLWQGHEDLFAGLWQDGTLPTVLLTAALSSGFRIIWGTRTCLHFCRWQKLWFASV